MWLPAGWRLKTPNQPQVSAPGGKFTAVNQRVVRATAAPFPNGQGIARCIGSHIAELLAGSPWRESDAVDHGSVRQNPGAVHESVG